MDQIGKARQIAFGILRGHGDCLRDDVVLNELIEDIAKAIVSPEDADTIDRLTAELEIQRDSQISAVNQMLAAEVREAEARAQLATARRGGEVALRAARLGLFTIRKQNAMPNSSWEAGFEKDIAEAERSLSPVTEEK